MTIQHYMQSNFRPLGAVQIIGIFAVLMVCNVLLRYGLRTGYIRRRQMKSLLALTFYLSLVFLGTVIARKHSVVQFNLTPFSSWVSAFIALDGEALWSVVLNVAMFVPIGWLLVTSFRHSPHPAVLVLIGTALSVTIEFSQFVFQCGFVEVDDVINNTLGCALGIVLKNAVQRAVDGTHAAHGYR